MEPYYNHDESPLKRLSILSGHWAVESLPKQINPQGCAASTTIAYARPIFDDVGFARPTSSSCHSSSLATIPPPIFPSSTNPPKYARPVSISNKSIIAHNNYNHVITCPSSSSSFSSSPTITTNSMVWKPKVNIKLSSLGWVLEVAVPGFNCPEDIRVELDSKHRCITILSRGGEKNNNSSRVKTVWRLPGGADQESLRSEWQDGMVRVYVSRKIGGR